MATASEIVKQAFREGNILAYNVDLTADQEAEGLTLLNRFLESLLGFELGVFSYDWPVPPSVTAPVNARFPLYPYSTELASNVWPYPPSNVRILMDITADTTIYLDQAPSDGARVLLVNISGANTNTLTVQGNGRLINSADTLSGTPATLDQTLLFYRADLGSWVTVSSLEAATESPLPSLYDDLLALGTFIRLAPRYSKTASAEVIETRRRLLKRMRAQYRQPVGVPSQNPQPFIRPAGDPLTGRVSTSRIDP